jgi:hypothetical protein
VWSEGDEEQGCVATYRSIVHRDVVHKDVFDDVDFVNVLAQRTDGDTVGAVAVQVLDEDVGAVWFEGDAVWSSIC